MSLTVESGTMVTFPNQQTITDYINGHPLKTAGALNSPVVENTVSDSIQKVAEYFANREMPSDEIRKNIKEALTQEMVKLSLALRQLAINCKSINIQSGNNQPDTFTTMMEDLYSQSTKQSRYLPEVVELYEHVLRDLLDRAPFTPPADGSEKWTRHVVEDLTEKKGISPGQTDLNKNYV